jgi:hypothetical protein
MVNPKSERTHDHYERPVSGIKAAICAKCNDVKPLSEFKRKLSRMQSQARGYVGAHALEIESSMCKACQPKAKPLKELPLRALKNRAATGDTRPYIVNAILAERKENKVKSGRLSSLKRWRKVYDALWGSVIEGVKAELLAVHQQRKYAVKKESRQPTLAYIEAYKNLLSQTKAAIGLAAAQAQGGPEKNTEGESADTAAPLWLRYIDNEEKNKTLALWHNIDPALRTQMRPPAILRRPE